MRLWPLQFALSKDRRSRRAPAPRLYGYIRQKDGERARIHLRINPDRSGVLFINADIVLHLNQTAATMAWAHLEGAEEDQALELLRQLFRVDRKQAKGDYAQFTAELDELLRPNGLCPLHDLQDVAIAIPFSSRPTAPYRMDLALTYRCNNECAHCYNGRPRTYPEMPTSQWLRVLEQVYALGIPHVVFTGGEPTLRHDLPDLIAYAQKIGLIAGLNTNGRRLSDPQFLARLVEAGLDHVQITLESYNPAIHDRLVARPGAWQQTIAGIKNVLETPVYMMTNTTLLAENSPFLEETLRFLGSLGVPTVGLNGLIYSGKGLHVGAGLEEEALPALLDLARAITNQQRQRLIWYTPTQTCRFDPMQLELGVKGCTAALFNMCVEPNGDVIPCQSYYQALGNLLADPWESIWNHELAVHLRERRYVPQACLDCSLLPECGGGCPLRPSPPRGAPPPASA